MAKSNERKTAKGSALKFEVRLWAAAQALSASYLMEREYFAGRMESPRFVLIVLKYISEAREEICERLLVCFSNSIRANKPCSSYIALTLFSATFSG